MVSRISDQEGSATVWFALVSAGILIVMGLLVAGGSALTARTQAQSIADLAALAGANQLPLGSAGSESADVGCDAAESVARKNGADLVSCWRHGNDLLVVVERSVFSPAFPAKVGAKAKAGPMFSLEGG